MARAASFVAAVSIAGCTLPNPAFDEREAETRAELGDTRSDGDGDGDHDGESGEANGDGDGDGESESGDGDGDSPCPPPLSDCEGQCVDLDKDPNNCGDCGAPCGQHEVCAFDGCVESKYIFVTSTPTVGGLGGLEMAHELCQTHASEARLPGDYLAWLSTTNVGAASFHSHVGPYVRRDGKIIAHNWQDLIDGQLNVPIDLDETGAPIEPAAAPSCQLDFAVWTGTDNAGSWGGDTCGEWASSPEMDEIGNVGNAKSVDAWSTSGQCSEACELMLPLYCVRQ
ncbi:hypothetical protein [Enhygromyxa salina]|nr:hypothetical protein [Enhygromyxa salina]